MSDDLSGDMLAPSWPNLVFSMFCLHHPPCLVLCYFHWVTTKIRLPKFRLVLLRRIPGVVFTPQPLRAIAVLFSPMVSGRAGGRREKVSLFGLLIISETVRCRKFILGRDIG